MNEDKLTKIFFEFSDEFDGWKQTMDCDQFLKAAGKVLEEAKKEWEKKLIETMLKNIDGNDVKPIAEVSRIMDTEKSNKRFRELLNEKMREYKNRNDNG